MTALALVADETDPVALSPARQALSNELLRIALAQADVDRVSRPIERLREQDRIASEQLAAAESDLAELDRAHAMAIRDQAREGQGGAIELPKAPARAKAEAAVESARHTRDAVRAALVEVQADADAPSVVLAEAMASTDRLVMAVMTEEHDAALDRLARAAAEHEAALTEARAIRAAVLERARGLQKRAPDEARAWYVVGGAMTTAGEKLAVPRTDQRDATARWSAAISALATDATAMAG
jgi:hypothetical protein